MLGATADDGDSHVAACSYYRGGRWKALGKGCGAARLQGARPRRGRFSGMSSDVNSLADLTASALAADHTQFYSISAVGA